MRSLIKDSMGCSCSGGSLAHFSAVCFLRLLSEGIATPPTQGPDYLLTQTSSLTLMGDKAPHLDPRISPGFVVFGDCEGTTA